MIPDTSQDSLGNKPFKLHVYDRLTGRIGHDVGPIYPGECTFYCTAADFPIIDPTGTSGGSAYTSSTHPRPRGT